MSIICQSSIKQTQLIITTRMIIYSTDVYKVTAIMIKMPANSSFDADFIIPFEHMKKSKWYSEEWSNNSITTYILLSKGSNIDAVNEEITKVTRENHPESKIRFLLFPYLMNHLHSYRGFGQPPGAIVYIWIFASVALLVLIIACINFTNLSTARSAARAKETGLRKLVNMAGIDFNYIETVVS